MRKSREFADKVKEVGAKVQEVENTLAGLNPRKYMDKSSFESEIATRILYALDNIVSANRSLVRAHNHIMAELAHKEKMENKERTLPKCGKCGGEARYQKTLTFGSSPWHIQCRQCHIRTLSYATKEDALKAWFTDKPEKNGDKQGGTTTP